MSASRSYLLGIDVGTQGSRALLIDTDGTIVGSETAEHKAFASPQPGWAEQEPDDWWDATATSIRALLSRTGIHLEAVHAVALAGQMHGAVLLDEADRVLRPALIWCDQRTQPQCDWLNAHIGAQRIMQWTANPALTNFTLTKLLWVRDNEPELFARMRRFLLPKDYVRLRMTGTFATDVADASGTLLLDVARRQWSREMFVGCDLPVSLAPPVFESSEICARVSQAGAEATGLQPGTPVIAGAGDQAAGAAGMGIVRPGAVSATIGTSGVMFAATDSPATDPKGRLHTFCHAVPGRWHLMGVTQAAGLSLRWFRDALASGTTYDMLSAEAEKSEAGARGLLWLPYLMGERTPHLDPEARGALVGLHSGHTRADVVRAIMEGVAFSLRDTLRIFEEMAVPVSQIRVAGGGARSRLWRQTQANVYGKEVELLQTEEGAAYGAALLAGVGIGVWRSVDDACAAVVKIREHNEPHRSAMKVLQARYDCFRALYPALKSATKCSA